LFLVQAKKLNRHRLCNKPVGRYPTIGGEILTMPFFWVMHTQVMSSWRILEKVYVSLYLKETQNPHLWYYDIVRKMYSIFTPFP
jgi:hypothetical protein